MVKNWIALGLILASQCAFAMTDWKCVNDCTRAGYQYMYCVKACSY